MYLKGEKASLNCGCGYETTYPTTSLCAQKFLFHLTHSFKNKYKLQPSACLANIFPIMHLAEELFVPYQ